MRALSSLARALLGALVLFSAAVAGPAAAQDVLPVPDLTSRVIDAGGVLAPDARATLDARLAALERERGAQVVVLLVPSTQPEDIAAYAQRVADTWKIGRREVGDGVLVVVAVNDRRVRIEVAKALEGAIPDLAARQIITNQITPAFRAGDYAGGLTAAVGQIAARIGAEGLPSPESPGGTGSVGTPGFDVQDVAIFLFVAVPIIATMLTGLFGRRLGSLLTAGAAGGMGWWFTASLVVAAGAAIAAVVIVGLFGVGATRRSGLGRRGPSVVWGGGHHGGGWSSGGFGGGGGGFGSGGGGDFGGGGASGDW